MTRSWPHASGSPASHRRGNCQSYLYVVPRTDQVVRANTASLCLGAQGRRSGILCHHPCAAQHMHVTKRSAESGVRRPPRRVLTSCGLRAKHSRAGGYWTASRRSPLGCGPGVELPVEEPMRRLRRPAAASDRAAAPHMFAYSRESFGGAQVGP